MMMAADPGQINGRSGLMLFDSYETRADESLLQLGRQRHADGEDSRRLRIAEASAAAVFIAVAVALAVFGSSARSLSAAALVVSVVAYLAAQHVRYPVGSAWTAPTQLVFVPMLFVLPTPLVPLIVAACSLADQVPSAIRGQLSVTRALARIADSFYSIGPVLVLMLFDAQVFAWASLPIYLLAFIAQVGCDAGAGLTRTWFAERVPPRDQLPMLWLYVTDGCLSCIGLLVAAGAGGGDLLVPPPPPPVALSRLL